MAPTVVRQTLPLLMLALGGPGVSLSAQTAGPVEIRVLISPGFAAAYDVLAPEFERMHGVRIVTGRGSSTGSGPGAIPGRVAAGEVVDVVIVSDEGMEVLTGSVGIIPASRVSLGRTGVGLAVPRGRPLPDVSTLDGLRRTLLEARSVAYSSGPSGAHVARVVLPALGITEEVTAKAVITNNVPAVLSNGQAEIGFQQVSELVPVETIDFAGPLPAEMQLATAYSAAIGSRSEHPQLAAALIAFLAAPEADPVVAQMGLERITADRP